MNKGLFRKIGVSTLLCWITCLAGAISLYMMFFYAPIEKTLGIAQYIFYILVPSAWIALLALLIVMIASATYLITISKKWDNVARASAEIGTLFCTLVLSTGALWAKLVWNVWWTWNWQLTIMLVFWLIYAAYLMLRRSVKGERGARGAAVFGIIAFLDIPFVYFSIRWWRTQHPDPVIMGAEVSGLEPEMLTMLLVAVITFMFLFFYLFQHRVAIENMEDELETIRRTVAEHERNRRDVLIENQNFIIEDYTFKEYKKDE